MAKGQKTSLEDVYKIMVGYASNRNVNALSRELSMPESTVRKIIEDNKGKDEFKKLCEEKEMEFVQRADEIIQKGTKLLNKRLDTALEQYEDLEIILDEALSMNKDELTQSEKKSLIKKISKLQINSLNEITTAIGTMYDKKALAKGEPTNNEKITITVSVVDE